MRRVGLLYVLVMLMVLPLAAQQEQNRAGIRYAAVAGMPATLQPANLSVVDGRLYFHGVGGMYSAAIGAGSAANPDIDVDLLRTDAHIIYMVRHPKTGRLWFTKLDRKGRSQLYECDSADKNPKAVHFANWKQPVEHPTFSSSGELIVFSSAEKGETRKRDLWYTQWGNGGWSAPRSLGKSISTEGDECNPVMVGDYLVFSSNRRTSQSDSLQVYRMYATRLVSSRSVFGDTVVPFPIGRSPVVALDVPFEGMSGGGEVAVDDQQGIVFWLAKNATEPNGAVVNSWQGSLEMICVRGRVELASNRVPVVGAHVSVCDIGHSTGVMAETETDSLGNYYMYVKPGAVYNIKVDGRNCVSLEQRLEANRRNGEVMIENRRLDFTLQSYDLGRRYTYRFDRRDSNLFDAPYSVALREKGEKVLEELLRFLEDNPYLYMNICVVSEADSDGYATLRTDARLDAIRKYVESHLRDGRVENHIRYKKGADSGEDATTNNAVVIWFEDENRGH